MADTPGLLPRTADQIRAELTEIAHKRGIQESTFIPWLIEIGDLTKAAQDAFEAQIFIDKFSDRCRDYSLAQVPGAAPKTVEQAKAIVGGGRKGRKQSPEAIRIGAIARLFVEAGYYGCTILSEFRTYVLSFKDDESAMRWATKLLKDNKGASKDDMERLVICCAIPKPPEPTEEERKAMPDRIKGSSAQRKCFACSASEVFDRQTRKWYCPTCNPKEDKPVSENMTPDPDLQALKESTAAMKDTNESLDAWFPRDDDNDTERPAALTVGQQAVEDVQAMKAKKDENIIDGEIIEESDTKPEQQETDFKLAAGKQVAEILNTAFPEATSTWKFNFYKEAVGYDGVSLAIDAIGPIKMFEKLNAAVEESKKAEKNLPTSENAPQSNEKAEISNAVPTTPVEPVSSNAGETDKKEGQNSKALTTYQPQTSVAVKSQPRFLMPTKDEFEYMKELASAVGMSKFYQNIDTKEKALVIMMKGYVLGVDPISALDGIYIINGRPYLSAKLLKGLVEKTGMCQRFDVLSENERCVVTIQRQGRSKPNVIEFTKEDAMKAGLWDSATWRKYPKDMLRNRAVMRAVKTEFPDVDLGPMASEEEQEFVEESTAV